MISHPVLYCHTARAGGAELASPLLAAKLNAVIWSRGEGVTTKRAQALGVHVKILPATVDRRPESMVGRVKAAASLIACNIAVLSRILRERPPVLVSNTLQGVLHVALPAWLTRTPLVVYVRDLGTGGNRSRLENRVYDALLSLCARGVVFNSRATQKSWNNKRPCIVISTAVEERYFQAARETESAGVVMVGRIARWKGQAEVIRAMNLLAAGGTKLQLTLIGDQTFGDDVDLPEAHFPIEFAGFSDPLEHLRTGALLVHASVTPEPFGQVLAQAAAVGIPIVCSNRGGHTEWLNHGISCLMADPNSPADLSRAIMSALQDSTESAARAVAARSASERFRADVAYAPLQEWIVEVCGK